MKKRILLFGVAGLVGLAAFTSLRAQAPAQPEITLNENLKLYFNSDPVKGNTVTGAPYSADSVTETTQTLGDGNRIDRSTSMKLYRDSQGRERQEEGGTEPTRILISDPVANASFTLIPETHMARKSTATIRITGDPSNELKTVELRLNDLADYVEKTRIFSSSATGAAALAPIPNGGRVKREQLSPQTVEGVYATGTRTTTTIPAGQIGNRDPIQVVDEVWYSPDLRMNVMTRHSDPRSGDVVYRLTNISRSEPDASLFQVPADYKVNEGGGRGRGPVTFTPSPKRP